MTSHMFSILVVDDDTDILAMLGTALRRAGYQPTLVTSVGDALQAMATATFAAVLTDYGITNQMASQVIEYAQQHDPIPVIVLMTGHSRDFLAEQIGRLPITAFLLKPFSLNTLYSTLSQCLETNDGRMEAEHPNSETVVYCQPSAWSGVGIHCRR